MHPRRTFMHLTAYSRVARPHVISHIYDRARVQFRRMGQLVSGKWEENPPKELPLNTDFRSWLTKDGSDGPQGQKGFPAAAGRYALYLNFGCPFAHRTHITWALKGLDKFIELVVVNPPPTPEGWSFKKEFPGTTGDLLFPEHHHIYQTYLKANPNATTRCSVPVLFDKETNSIVSNESGEIIRQFDLAFDDLGAKPGNYYPLHLQKQIDELNGWIFPSINASYFKIKAQGEPAIKELYDALDKVDAILSKNKWLLGDVLTEADNRLFVTLIRYNYSLVPDLKLDRKLETWPNVFEWTKQFYQLPGVAATVHPDAIRGIHSLEGPIPEIDWSAPVKR